MILVDTSIWIDHLRRSDEILNSLLLQRRVVVHPFIIGEVAMGGLRDRAAVLTNLGKLPRAIIAADGEVLGLIDRFTLFGTGIGYLDAHLLASTRLTPGATLWTRDRRLREAATRLGIAADIAA